MFCNGVYLDDYQLNRLFQVQSNPHFNNFSLLLRKPVSWNEYMVTNNKAIQRLRQRLLEPIPHAFIDRDCPEFINFRKFCQSPEGIWLLGEKVSVIYIIIALNRKYPWLQMPASELNALIVTSPIPCL